jgi:hypothetical protein
VDSAAPSGLVQYGIGTPNVETLGYCRLSLRRVLRIKLQTIVAKEVLQKNPGFQFRRDMLGILR